MAQGVLERRRPDLEHALAPARPLAIAIDLGGEQAGGLPDVGTLLGGLARSDQVRELVGQHAAVVGGAQAQPDLQPHLVVEAQQIDGAIIVVVVDLAAIQNDQVDPAVFLDALAAALLVHGPELRAVQVTVLGSDDVDHGPAPSRR